MAEKETKYVVIKIDDIRNHLSQTEKYILELLLQQIDDEREKIGKLYNEYIVCNKDEPYAEDVWQAILMGEDSKADNQALTLSEHIEQMRESYEALERQRDEFRLELITRAGELQCMAEEKDELVRERDALAAHVDHLRSGYQHILEYWNKDHNETAMADALDFCESLASDMLEDFPAQSLSHIKAQVEEETIERILSVLELESENADSEIDLRDWRPLAKEAADLMYRYARSGIKNMPRKYAKQAGSTVEEGE